jgi:hypothetical protein
MPEAEKSFPELLRDAEQRRRDAEQRQRPQGLTVSLAEAVGPDERGRLRKELKERQRAVKESR